MLCGALLRSSSIPNIARHFSVVSVESNATDNVAKIVFDDGKMNIFSFDAIAEFNKCLDDCKDAGSVIITGNSKAMSAGFDLSVMGTYPSTDSAEMLRQGGELMLRIANWERPVVIASSGHTLALGAIMLFAGDLRIGISDNSKAKFGLNEVAIGLPVPTCGMVIGRNRLSSSYLYRATVLAEVYDANEAVTAGYLDYLVPSDQLEVEAIKKASIYAKYNKDAYLNTKYMATGFDMEKAKRCLAADVAAFMPKKE
mmetsp:Transcript_13197/g.17100  ORF Transcript_13197/g.17100 Transcript_13197/m.17100 type:complete len:255 (-) Transcript_13197:137-901(-)